MRRKNAEGVAHRQPPSRISCGRSVADAESDERASRGTANAPNASIPRFPRGPLDEVRHAHTGNDLCGSGYNTLEHDAGFADPPSLRSYLANARQQTGPSLGGAILIGNLPHAYQFVAVPGPSPSSEEVISFQYYADLDGVFTRSAGYTSPGGHEFSYDQHTGDVGWEIWVGVLPIYKGDLQQSADALNRYFAKNHAYRVGLLARPHVFLVVSEHFVATTLDQHDVTLVRMRSGTYSWTPYSSTTGARLYFNSVPGGLSPQRGYADMSNGVADFTVTETHGSWVAAGQLTIAAVGSHPVKTLFFWSDGCAVGDLDHADNFLSSVTYSATSDVLVAKGTTNNSGWLGNNANGYFGHNVAQAMADGAAFGDALLTHVNTPLIAPWAASREFHLGTVVILGDPTLRRTNEWQEQESFGGSCKARPGGAVCVRYSDAYVWLVNDSIGSWSTRVIDGVTIETAAGARGAYEHMLNTTSVRVAH